MELSKLYSRAVNGKTNEFTIRIQGNKYQTISGFTDGVKTVSKWTVCEAKTYCTAEEQATKQATAIHRKKMETGWFEDISSIDDVAYFEPMLAHDFEKEKHKIKFPVFSQPKLDGIRCIVKSDGMWSRNGKKIISAPHVFDSMKHIFAQNPNLIFDGELYADKFANDFNAICSLVKKTKPTEDDLKESSLKIEYHIYDLPSCSDVFSVRYSELSKLNLPKCCVLVPTISLGDLKQIENQHDEYVSQGYEGQIIRLDKPYENKRSKSLLKHKSFIDEEFTILDIEEGIGNKSGMVGAFVFENENGKRFKASPKYNWEECIEIWKQKHNLIGKSATVKYFNLTPDGVPRFGYVINIDRNSYE